jgi:hypothetical protein
MQFISKSYMQIKRAKPVAAGIYMQYARYGKHSFRFADSGLKIASLNSRVFCSPGMGPNVAVLHVDNYNFASGLLIFFNFYFF